MAIDNTDSQYPQPDVGSTNDGKKGLERLMQGVKDIPLTVIVVTGATILKILDLIGATDDPE